MDKILACIDASAYAAGVCDLAAWASARLSLPIALLHVVQRRDAVAERRDLSGAIGLGVKTDLLEELTRFDAADARLQVERGRALLASAESRLRASGAADLHIVHRHGGIVETILEQEAEARLVVIGRRGASHAFAIDHIGSKIERVVRASSKPVIIASSAFEVPRTVILAYDGSGAADRALDRLKSSPLFAGLPVAIVCAGGASAELEARLETAARQLDSSREVRILRQPGRPEAVIATAVADTPGAMLVMGAYGHSPLRKLIVGSTTTTMIRTVSVPVLLVR